MSTLTRTYRDPHFCFHLHTNDVAVAEFLESYLCFRESAEAFTPFFEFHYHITYQDRATVKRAEKAVYHVMRTGENTLHARVGEAVSDVMLDVAKQEITAKLYNFDNEMGVMDFTFLQPCRTTLALKGWMYMHAAHVHSATHDILITGPSGAGKSSIGYTLGAHPAYCLQSDDEVFIRASAAGNECLPFPTKIGFKNAAMQQMLQAKQEASSTYGNKPRFALPTAPQHFFDVVVRPTWVLKPRYDVAAKSLELIPLEQETIVQEVADFSFPMLNLAGWPQEAEGLHEMLGQFMQRAQLYTLVYNDKLLAEIPDFIAAWTP